MNKKLMDNDNISVAHLIAEQQPDVDNQQVENSTQNETQPKKIVNVTNKVKKSPMTPTPLEYSWCSRHRSLTTAGVFAVFTSIAMTIGILIVCFTSSKVSAQKCELNFTKTMKNPIEYNYGPRSVVVGNFNNDNHKWLDITVANRIVNSISVFLDYNNGTFASQTTYPTGSYSAPYMIVVGDFNNDHQADIAVANFGTNSIGIFLGFGNGSFANQNIILTASSRPVWIHTADLDNDTLLDIVIANYGTDSVSIFYGYGDGKFSYPITYLTGYDSSPFSVITGDLNNDNHLDLIIANYGTNNIGILLANGTRTYLDQKTFPTGYNSHPYSVAVDHFNNDTLLDIAVANYGANNVGVLLGTGYGNFTSQTTYLLNTSSPYSIGLGDFNKDTRLDLIVTNKGTYNIGVLLGLGNGTFSKAIMNSTGSSSSTSVAVADFNHDNLLHIIIVNDDTNSIGILFGYDEGFQTQKTYSTGSGPSSVAVGDFNNDTQLDIVVANYNNNTISVLLGYGNGSFANQVTYLTGAYPQSVAVGDFNKDTLQDIVVANYNDNTISVLLGYGNGSFANQITYPTGVIPISVAVGDFNNDSRLDIVVANMVNANISVFLGHVNRGFKYLTTLITRDGSLPQSFVVGDFNSDTHMDIVVANSGTNNIGVFLGFGNNSFANQTTYSTGSGPWSLVVGYLNNDTRLDIIVTNVNDSSISILLGYGNGSFENQKIYLTGSNSEPYSVAAGDFNNDILLDIIVANHRANNIVIFLGYGDGTFTDSKVYLSSYGSSPFSVVVGDFNKDKKLDFAVANYDTDNLNILLQTC